MMQPYRSCLRCFCCFLVLLTTPISHAEISKTVILLSWDGMRHDFPERGDFPALQRMETDGLRAKRLTPVSLSNTFPGHVSIATGATPDVHGIIDNVFLDREKGLYAYSGGAEWLNAEPLWATAERQGIKAATYFWVGSETNWPGHPTSYRMAPFDGSRAESEKVDKIIEWLDLPEAERPGLIMSYWRGADSVSHLKGPDHEEVAEIIATQDIQLGRLLTALDERDLWSSTTLIVTTDHGVTEVTESIPAKSTLIEAGLKVRVTGGGAAQHIYLESEADREQVKALLAANPNINVFEGSDIPKGMRAHNRTGDLVITTVAPYTFSEPESFVHKAVVFFSPIMGWSKGDHGYDPQSPDMGGIFLAMGNGVHKGKKLGNVHQLDIAPTVAKLLGIRKPAKASRNGIHLGRVVKRVSDRDRAAEQQTGTVLH